MSSALNKNWAYAMIYRDDLFIKACQVDVEGSGMTSDDLILDICQPNQTYRIAYYNVDWEVIQVDVVQTPKELAITYAGKNTVIVTYPYNAGEQIEIVPSNPSTLHHTSSKGQSIFNGLNPNQSYSVILRDSNDNQIDIVKVKANDLQVPAATVLSTTDSRIKWQVSNAKHLTAKVYKSDDLYGTIEGEAYIGSNLQELEVSGLDNDTLYTIIIENNSIWTSNQKTDAVSVNKVSSLMNLSIGNGGLGWYSEFVTNENVTKMINAMKECELMTVDKIAMYLGIVTLESGRGHDLSGEGPFIEISDRLGDYKGAGLIQISKESVYRAFSIKMSDDRILNGGTIDGVTLKPYEIVAKLYPIESATYYWNEFKNLDAFLNTVYDGKDPTTIDSEAVYYALNSKINGTLWSDNSLREIINGEGYLSATKDYWDETNQVYRYTYHKGEYSVPAPIGWDERLELYRNAKNYLA